MKSYNDNELDDDSGNWEICSIPTVDNELISIRGVSKKYFDESVYIKNNSSYNREKLIFIESIWTKTNLFEISNGDFIKARSIIKEILSKDELQDFFKLQTKLYFETKNEISSENNFTTIVYEFASKLNEISKKFLDNKKRQFIDDLL